MLGLNIKYELISVFRNAWIQILAISLLLLCIFAAYNGKSTIEKRNKDILAIQQKADSSFQSAVLLLDSIERGEVKGLEWWMNPQTPSYFGNRHPRIAAMPATPLSLMAAGQSDLFTHAIKVGIYGESSLLNFTELASPVQLLFGAFDLAFVFTYLLPLIIIAFSYNLLSAEKEQGSLRLIMSQPLRLITWVYQKAFIRLGIVTLLSMIALILAFLLAGVPIIEQSGEILRILLLLIGYIAFWFLVSAWVNIMGTSSANNAVVLLAIWVVLVLLIPSVLSRLSGSLYPVPSRTLLVNELREANAEAEKSADSLLSSYYRAHPELMPDSSKAETYLFYKQYFASQEIVRKRIAPLVQEYDAKLEEQQNWINKLRFISPAILLSDALTDIAGTNARNYTSFRKQVVAFSEQWRDFFVPKIFKSESLTRADVDKFPVFAYREANYIPRYVANLSVVYLLDCLVLLFGFIGYDRRITEQLST